MRKLLVFQHVPFEPLGTLDGLFRQAGFRIRYVNFHRQAETRVRVARYHGLVVLGGPMAADQFDRYPHLRYEQDAIREAVRHNMPVLGICLGAQLLAASLGGSNLRGAAPEFGWCEVAPTAAGRVDPLLAHFGAAEQIFQWHSDAYTLPAGATQLARSAVCEQQAFRYGDYVYGFQFHLEVDRALILRWLGRAQRGAASQRQHALDADEIVEETHRYMRRSANLSRMVFGEFIERFFRWRRRLALSSR